MLLEDLKTFLEKNIDLIDAHKFNDLYEKSQINQRGFLTQALLFAKINPLDYFTYKIPRGAFIRTFQFTDVGIPEGIQIIDTGAFHECENLHEIHLPSTLVELGMRCFGYCKNLSTVYYNGTSEQWTNVTWKLDPFVETAVKQIVCKDTVIEYMPYRKE